MSSPKRFTQVTVIGSSEADERLVELAYEAGKALGVIAGTIITGGRGGVMEAVSRPSNPVASSGKPFVLKLPLPKGTDKANLAIESVQPGAKGRSKSTWRVIPMTKLETSDDGNRAVFEIRELPDAHVYLTSQDPTTAPAATE